MSGPCLASAYAGQKRVGPVGFEPPTPGLKDWCPGPSHALGDDVSEMLSPSLDGLELTEHVVTGEVNSSRNRGGPEFLEAVSPQ